MNKVILVGNLVREPELKVTTTGLYVCTFTIAVPKKLSQEQKANGTKESSDFIPVVVWRWQAENCGKYLSKGKKVAISGSLSTRTYDAKDGTKRYVTEVVADDVEFLSPADHSEPQQGYKEGIQQAVNTFMSGVEPVINADELPF